MQIPFTNLVIRRKQGHGGIKKRATVFGGLFFGDKRDRIKTLAITTSTYYEMYRINADVAACVRAWSRNVGLMGYNLVNPMDPEKEIPQDLWNKYEAVMNYGRGYKETIRVITEDLAICGNAYMAMTKNQRNEVIGLDRIDPRTVSTISDSFGNIYAYVQRSAGEDAVLFTEDEVLHFRDGTDFSSPLFGESRMRSVMLEILTDNEAAITNWAFFENNAVPNVNYILKEGLSEEEQKKAAEAISENFKGSENSNKSAILAGVERVEVISVNHRDMQYLEGRKFTTDKVHAAYGTPKFLSGYTESVNNNNGTELRADFYMSTVVNIEEVLAGQFTTKLMRALGYADMARHMFIPQSFEGISEVQKTAIEEYKVGLLTLRQYKLKTGQEVTSEDEENPNIDKHIVLGGSSAVLLSDVGLELIDSEGITEDNSLRFFRANRNAHAHLGPVCNS